MTHQEQDNTTIHAWFDGSCGPVNPGGTARYGIVVKANGETVHSSSGLIGTGREMSCNVAEYAAVNAVMLYLIEKRNYRQSHNLRRLQDCDY